MNLMRRMRLGRPGDDASVNGLQRVLMTTKKYANLALHCLCVLPHLCYTHTRLTTLCPGLPGWAGTRKVKPIWILLKQETVSGSGICWAICKSAPRSSQITTPVPHHSVFYRPDALPAAQPTASKYWRQRQHHLCYIWLLLLCCALLKFIIFLITYLKQEDICLIFVVFAVVVSQPELSTACPVTSV